MKRYISHAILYMCAACTYPSGIQWQCGYCFTELTVHHTDESQEAQNSLYSCLWFYNVYPDVHVHTI